MTMNPNITFPCPLPHDSSNLSCTNVPMRRKHPSWAWGRVHPTGCCSSTCSFIYIFTLVKTSRHLSRLLGHEQAQGRIDATQLEARHYSNQGPCLILRRRPLDNAVTPGPVVSADNSIREYDTPPSLPGCQNTKGFSLLRPLHNQFLSKASGQSLP